MENDDVYLLNMICSKNTKKMDKVCQVIFLCLKFKQHAIHRLAMRFHKK